MRLDCSLRLPMCNNCRAEHVAENRLASRGINPPHTHPRLSSHKSAGVVGGYQDPPRGSRIRSRSRSYCRFLNSGRGNVGRGGGRSGMGSKGAASAGGSPCGGTEARAGFGRVGKGACIGTEAYAGVEGAEDGEGEAREGGEKWVEPVGRGMAKGRY
eukprot:Gb_28822 [translate_table: standard]